MSVDAGSMLEVVVESFEGLRPSVRTWNLLGREGYATVGALMTLTPETILEWRNSNSQTVQDIEVMQEALTKMLRVKHKIPLQISHESRPAYAIRLVQWEVWWEAHDDICPRWWDCHLHRNPFEEP